MAGIREMRQRQAQWAQERPEGQGQNYFPRNGDIVFFHFISTGEDGDPFFEIFYSHEIPAQGQGQWPTLKFCPRATGLDDNYDCPHCVTDIKTKKRMMMWLHVYEILHTTLRQGETLPTVTYMGRNYFRREVNDVRVWDTSAWRESPVDDILNLAEQIGNLHTYVFTLHVTGEQLDRRFKVYIQQGSKPFDGTLYNAAKAKCQPILDMLMDQIKPVSTEQRPVAQPQPVPAAAAPSAQVYTPPGAGAAQPAAPISGEYTPPGGWPEPQKDPTQPGPPSPPQPAEGETQGEHKRLF